MIATTRTNKTSLLALAAIFSLLVASSADAQRLRGVLKRPLHGHMNKQGNINNADTKDAFDNELMAKMSEFDDLIWQMAAAGEEEQDAKSKSEKRSLLRWRKRGIAAEGNDGQETKALTALDVSEGPGGPWPSCIGKKAEECEDHITFLNDKLQLIVLPYGSIVTADFREDRVRLFVDENDFVKTEPRVS